MADSGRTPKLQPAPEPAARATRSQGKSDGDVSNHNSGARIPNTKKGNSSKAPSAGKEQEADIPRPSAVDPESPADIPEHRNDFTSPTPPSIVSEDEEDLDAMLAAQLHGSRPTAPVDREGTTKQGRQPEKESQDVAEPGVPEAGGKETATSTTQSTKRKRNLGDANGVEPSKRRSPRISPTKTVESSLNSPSSSASDDKLQEADPLDNNMLADGNQAAPEQSEDDVEMLDVQLQDSSEKARGKLPQTDPIFIDSSDGDLEIPEEEKGISEKAKGKRPIRPGKAAKRPKPRKTKAAEPNPGKGKKVANAKTKAAQNVSRHKKSVGRAAGKARQARPSKKQAKKVAVINSDSELEDDELELKVDFREKIERYMSDAIEVQRRVDFSTDEAFRQTMKKKLDDIHTNNSFKPARGTIQPIEFLEEEDYEQHFILPMSLEDDPLGDLSIKVRCREPGPSMTEFAEHEDREWRSRLHTRTDPRQIRRAVKARGRELRRRILRLEETWINRDEDDAEDEEPVLSEAACILEEFEMSESMKETREAFKQRFWNEFQQYDAKCKKVLYEQVLLTVVSRWLPEARFLLQAAFKRRNTLVELWNTLHCLGDRNGIWHIAKPLSKDDILRHWTENGFDPANNAYSWSDFVNGLEKSTAEFKEKHAGEPIERVHKPQYSIFDFRPEERFAVLPDGNIFRGENTWECLLDIMSAYTCATKEYKEDTKSMNADIERIQKDMPPRIQRAIYGYIESVSSAGRRGVQNTLDNALKDSIRLENDARRAMLAQAQQPPATGAPSNAQEMQSNAAEAAVQQLASPGSSATASPPPERNFAQSGREPQQNIQPTPTLVLSEEQRSQQKDLFDALNSLAVAETPDIRLRNQIATDSFDPNKLNSGHPTSFGSDQNVTHQSKSKLSKSRSATPAHNGNKVAKSSKSPQQGQSLPQPPAYGVPITNNQQSRNSHSITDTPRHNLVNGGREAANQNNQSRVSASGGRQQASLSGDGFTQSYKGTNGYAVGQGRKHELSVEPNVPVGHNARGGSSSARTSVNDGVRQAAASQGYRHGPGALIQQPSPGPHGRVSSRPPAAPQPAPYFSGPQSQHSQQRPAEASWYSLNETTGQWEPTRGHPSNEIICRSDSVATPRVNGTQSNTGNRYPAPFARPQPAGQQSSQPSVQYLPAREGGPGGPPGVSQAYTQTPAFSELAQNGRLQASRPSNFSPNQPVQQGESSRAPVGVGSQSRPSSQISSSVTSAQNGRLQNPFKPPSASHQPTQDSAQGPPGTSYAQPRGSTQIPAPVGPTQYGRPGAPDPAP